MLHFMLYWLYLRIASYSLVFRIIVSLVQSGRSLTHTYSAFESLEGSMLTIRHFITNTSSHEFQGRLHVQVECQACECLGTVDRERRLIECYSSSEIAWASGHGVHCYLVCPETFSTPFVGQTSCLLCALEGSNQSDLHNVRIPL